MLKKGEFKPQRNFVIPLVLLYLCMFISVSVPVSTFAAVAINCEYDLSNEEIRMNGNGAKAHGLVTLVLLPASIDVDDPTFSLPLTADNKPKYVLKTLRADKDGNFSEEIVLPDWLESDTYTLYVTHNGERNSEYTFSYVNQRSTKELIEKVNAATEAELYTPESENEAASGILYDYPFDMGTNHIDVLTYGALMAKNLIVSQPAAGYENAVELIEVVQQVVAWGKIELAPISTEETEILTKEKLVENNDTLFGIDYDKEFKNLPLEAKESFYGLFGDWAGDIALKDTFMQSLILSQVTNSISYTDVKDVILNYKDYLNIDLSDYEKLNQYQRSQVFSIFANQGVNHYEEIADCFYTAVSEAAKRKEPGLDDNHSSGGGSGGGSSGRQNSSTTVISGTSISSEIDKPEANEKKIFSDMNHHWAKNVVEKLSEKNIIAGYSDGSFRPDNMITRAEFAKLVVAALDFKGGTTTEFRDVSENDWFYNCVNIAAGNGLIIGYDGLFVPDAFITRQDAALILYRALAKKSMITDGTYEFLDEQSISAYAKVAVETLASQNIVKGYDGKFSPTSNTTRGETAQMIYNVLEFIKGQGEK